MWCFHDNVIQIGIPICPLCKSERIGLVDEGDNTLVFCGDCGFKEGLVWEVVKK